jgi:hypothetical protein
MLYILVLRVRGYGASTPCSITAVKAPYAFQRGEPSWLNPVRTEIIPEVTCIVYEFQV